MAWLGLAWLGLAGPARYTPLQQRDAVQIVAKFFVAKIVQNSTKINTKSLKIEKMRPRAPKSVTKGAQVNLPQLLGPSWATLGTLPGRPGRAPGRPKRGQEHQNSSLKPFFTHFFASFLRVAFRIDFFTLMFATICTETLKISIFPRESTHFCKIDFFV